MTVPDLHLTTVLTRMADKDIICRSSVHSTVALFGEHPKPNRKTMHRALKMWGPLHFRRFMEEWLGWPVELTLWLSNLNQTTLWPTRTSKHARLRWDQRSRLVHEQHIAATLAYIKEIKKP